MHSHRRTLSIAMWLAGSVCATLGCDSQEPTRPAGAAEPSPAGQSAGLDNSPPSGPPLYRECTAELGLPTSQPALPDGTFALREIMGPGIGVFDYDLDGRLDLVVPQCPPPGQPGRPAPNLLYHQTAAGIFEEVGQRAGLADPGVGQAVTIGDVDNDGDPDVYFNNFGPDAFYRNRGDGTFENATLDAGLGQEKWSCAGAFADYDRDGALDLFVVNYVKFDAKVECFQRSTEREYCGPKAFASEVDVLYRNQGDGRFADVGRELGIQQPGAGLGVIGTDLTNDGWVDYYVTNDAEVNHFWIQKDGRFQDEAYLRGVGVNRKGQPEASMGVTVGDVDGDGVFDLFMTHLEGENNTLYVSGDSEFYTDASSTSTLSRYDRDFTGFGCAFVDADLDGLLDLAVVNGRVRRSKVHPSAQLGKFWNGYAEPNQLFLGTGAAKFTPAMDRCDTFGTLAEIGRGLAIADLNGDGALDLFVSNYGGPLRVYYGTPPSGQHWLIVRPRCHGRAALGAAVTIRIGELRRLQPCLAAYSYASSSDPIAHFGLGSVARVDALEIRWPDGSRELFPGCAADQLLVLDQGTGAPQ